MSDEAKKGNDQETEEGPLESAFRKDMTEALAALPRIAAAFERRDAGEGGTSLDLSPDEVHTLNTHILWTLQKHIGALATEVDRLRAELE